MLSSQKYYSKIKILKIFLGCHLISPQLLAKISPELSGDVTSGLFPKGLWIVMELQVFQV